MTLIYWRASHFKRNLLKGTLSLQPGEGTPQQMHKVSLLFLCCIEFGWKAVHPTVVGTLSLEGDWAH